MSNFLEFWSANYVYVFEQQVKLQAIIDSFSMIFYGFKDYFCFMFVVYSPLK